MLALHVLASGSSGNAAMIENTATGAGVLIDCGICKRDFLNRCDEAGFDPGRIQAMFVTHEHGDHVKGLGVVLRGLAKIGQRAAGVRGGRVHGEQQRAGEGGRSVRPPRAD